MNIKLNTSKRFFFAAIFAIAFCCSQFGTRAIFADEPEASVQQIEAQRIAGIQKAYPTVLAIFASGGAGGGSGVVVSKDGYALTNFHVTKPCGNFMKCGMPDGKMYDAVIVGVDPVGDVALIKLHGRDDFPTAELANSDDVQVGDFCFAMGNPFLLATDFTPSVSYGVVSGAHRYQYPEGTLLEYADCLQTDAAINPGNSGGPLFDSQGRLIGINGRCSFEKRGRVNVGVGYAISINQIKKFMGALRSGRILDHATLGAQLGTSDSGKIAITNILEESDAYRRGLRYDDEILSFAGRQIRTVNSYKNMLGTLPRDWRVPLVFRREGKDTEILVRLKGVHREDELIAIMQGEGDPEGPKKPGDPPKPAPKPPEKKPFNPLEKLFSKETGPPAELKKQYVARAGFANYYFNKLEQDRLWKGLTKYGDFSKLKGTWTITGELQKGAKFTITLAEPIAKCEMPDGDSEADLSNGLSERLNPPGSNGLLAGLHLWKKLLTGGPAKFGQVVYEGYLPIPGRNELYDVLVGTTSEVDVRFYFSQKDGKLALVEFVADDITDPCEIYFDEYREVDGRMWPKKLTVRVGEKFFGSSTFNIDDIKAEEKSKTPENPKSE